MSKIHLDLKVTSAIEEAYLCSADEISQLSGANLGNFVFRYALNSLVDDFSEYRQVNYAQLNSIIGEEPIESVLVSCANWLGTREQDEKSNKFRADILERIDVPVISFGLGVQAGQGAESVDLGPESKRLARVLASKSELLSVRDKLTARVLKEIGISNVVITGCPSNFINTRPSLGSEIAATARSLIEDKCDWREMRTCVTEFSGGHAHSGAILKTTLKVLEASPSFYILQSPALLPFLFEESGDPPAAYSSNSTLGKDGVKHLLKSKTLHFSSVDSWLDFCRTCDFAFGMRVHGNMVPLQAGVPALLVGHDSRTSGLGVEMGMPVMNPEAFLEAQKDGPRLLLEHVAETMSEYDKKRKELAAVMESFLDGNNVPVHAKLRDLAQS